MKIMNPYISIIIPAYNEADKIKDTLENIKGIDEINEIIVMINKVIIHQNTHRA